MAEPTWEFYLDFNDGEGWNDITNLVKIDTIHIKKQIFNPDSLEPSVNSVLFDIRKDDKYYARFLLTKTDIGLKIYYDSALTFKGYLRKDFTIKSYFRVDPIQLEGIDPGYLLKKNIEYNICWANYKIWDSSNPTTSIVHQLMVKAGFSLSDVGTATINKTIDYFIVDKSANKSYWDVLKQLLWDYHYVFYFDDAGLMQNYDWDMRNVTNTGTFSSYLSPSDPGNMIGGMSFTKKSEKYTGAKITWWSHETLTNYKLSEDKTNGTEFYTMLVPLAQDEYYPSPSSDRTIYDEFIKYSVPEGKTLIAAVTAAMDKGPSDSFGAGKIEDVVPFTNYFTKAAYAVQNKNAVTYDIQKFNVVGNALVKGTTHITKTTISEGDQAIFNYDADYLYAQADALALAEALARYYKFSDFEYSIRSSSDYDDFEVGDIIRIKDYVTTVGVYGFPVIAVIVEVEEKMSPRDNGAGEVSWKRTRDYKLRGISEFAASYTETSSEVQHAPALESGVLSTANIPAMDLTDYATYSNLQAGYTEGGGTKTPDVPVVTATPIAVKAIKLDWDHQYNLTNFSHYLVQVSEDNANWYSLDSSGTDWKGTLDATTRVDVETYVHCNIPNGGTEEEPEGKLLYYRAKRVCYDATESAYSTAVSATTKVISVGDIAANTVYSNSVVTGFLNALIAQINEYLQVSSSGYLGATPVDQEVEGAQRARLDRNELTIEYYTEGAWTTVCKLGGDENGGFFPYAQLRGIAKPGAAQELGDLGIGDMVPQFSLLFKFNDNFADQNRVDWDTKVNSELTTTYKFGTHAARSTSGNTMVLTDTDARGSTFATSLFLDTWLDNVSFNASLEDIVVFESGKLLEYYDRDSYSPDLNSNYTVQTDVNPYSTAMIDSSHSVSIYVQLDRSLGTYIYRLYALPHKVSTDGAGTTGTPVVIDTYGSTLTTEFLKNWGSICRISDTKFVVSYMKISSAGTYYETYTVVGTLSGDSISFGTPVLVYGEGLSASRTFYSRVDKLDTNKVILVSQYSGTIYAAIGTVSGTSVSFASHTSLALTNVTTLRAVTVLSPTLVTLAYFYSTGNRIRISAFEISGATITPWSYSEADISVSADTINLEYLSSSKAVLTYSYIAGAAKASVITYNEAGNTLSIGGAQTLHASAFLRSTVNAGASHFIYTYYSGTTLYARDFTVSGSDVVANGTEVTLGASANYDKSYFARNYLAPLHTIFSAKLGTAGSDVINLWTVPLTYTKLYVQAGIDKLRFNVENWGISNTTSYVDTGALSTGWIHFSIHYDKANEIFHFTEGASELSTIDVSAKILSSSAQSLKLYSYSQRQIFDDMLFSPGSYQGPTVSTDHYASGVAWSTSVDNDLDLMIIPKNGGSVVMAGNVKSLTSDWVLVSSFSNSWANYGSGYATAAYRKSVEGQIELMGTISTGTAGQSAFTLPYTPSATLVFTVDDDGAHATVTIDTSGHVIPSANTRISLNGIRFEAS